MQLTVYTKLFIGHPSPWPEWLAKNINKALAAYVQAGAKMFNLGMTNAPRLEFHYDEGAPVPPKQSFIPECYRFDVDWTLLVDERTVESADELDDLRLDWTSRIENWLEAFVDGLPVRMNHKIITAVTVDWELAMAVYANESRLSA
jgi:hypothetical protein